MFGLIHRGIRLSQQRLDLLADDRKRRRSEARRDIQRTVITANGLRGDGGSELLGDGESPFPVDMRQDDGKFLASDTPEQIAGAKGRLANRGNRLENRISRGMPIGIVHLLEMVDIEGDAGQVMLVTQSERNQ